MNDFAVRAFQRLTARQREPQTLELRIHGIKNSTPASMLGVTADAIERADGDDLGAFWTEKAPPPELVKLRVRREAYSWGAMARSGGGPLALIGTLFVHLGWVLILPFGLCNVAYWTRRIPLNHKPGRWNGGRGAPVLRLFALGLTLIYVTALASVSLDLIGVQCYPLGAPPNQMVCNELPSFFGALSDLSRGTRLSILALIPLGIMLVLYAISHHARVRFEPNIVKLAKTGIAATVRTTPANAGSPTEAAPPAAPPPLLASAEFWVQARVGVTTERLHFSAVVLLLALLLANDRLYSANLDLQRFAADPKLDTVWSTFPSAFATSPIMFVCLVSAAALLLWVCILIVITSETDPDRILIRRGLSGWVLVLSGGVFLVIGISSAFDPASTAQLLVDATRPPTFIGLEATPTLLVGVLLGLSVAALGWRRGVPLWLSIVILVGALAFLVLGRINSVAPVVSVAGSPGLSQGVGTGLSQGVSSGLSWEGAPYYLGAVLFLAAELVIVVLCPLGTNRAERRAEFAYEGWRGMGPGVVMLLALGVAMTLASLVVVGFAAVLAYSLTDIVSDDGMFRAASPSPLIVPPAYVEFGVVLLGMLVAVLLCAAVILLPLVTRLFRLSTPALIRDATAANKYVAFSPRPGYGDDLPPVPNSFDRLEQRILKARRFAALAQRGEPILGLLAVVVGIGLVCTVMLRFPSNPAEKWAIAAPSIAVAMLSATALAAFAAIAQNALTKEERPLGVLWDVICFLPRAGHPFGPPCYSDRVVPELTSRVQKWLEPTDSSPKQRRVVLSAHSLGAVLAVSTIFAHASGGSAGAQTLSDGTEGFTPRIGLLTYGTQLRAYFGRILPELLGPAVLGTRPCQAPRLFGADPWLRQILDDQNQDGPQAPPNPGTLRAVLTPPTSHTTGQPTPPLWINVWRRTDYLGFPVHSYRDIGKDIDRGASELERKTYLQTVATHGNYPDTREYTGAIEDLLGRITPPPAGG